MQQVRTDALGGFVMNIPLKTLIQALDALKSAEAVFYKQLDGGGNWRKTMQARVGLEHYVNRALEGQNVSVKQNIEEVPV